jgi:hypothetical protein
MLQPQPDTLPSASARASSGRNALLSVTPAAKQKLEMMSSTAASSRSPGPTSASSAVLTTQPTVTQASTAFLRACTSA